MMLGKQQKRAGEARVCAWIIRMTDLAPRAVQGDSLDIGNLLTIFVAHGSCLHGFHVGVDIENALSGDKPCTNRWEAVNINVWREFTRTT